VIARIKKRLEKTLTKYAASLYGSHPVRNISPALSANIRNFISRPGKRVRPILFVLSYAGYKGRETKGLYKTALGIEILHDFFLVHDDIIDDSDLRRGLPAMHRMLSGKGPAIAAGDAMAAMALELFLSIDEAPRRKERALLKLFETILYTSAGEFIELESDAKRMENVTIREIYKTYDLKTAHYTFAAPLLLGAMAAGADRRELSYLYDCGISLGRAFQIRDDMLDMFATEKDTGKSAMTDLKESKKTLLLWHAYRRSGRRERAFMSRILLKKHKSAGELSRIRRIVRASGAVAACEEEISALLSESEKILTSLRMRRRYKSALLDYTRSLF
jgi:geranylgeranyl diphosphate synthase type I